MAYWIGLRPTTCDVCQTPITNQFIDGSIPRAGGAWGNVCPECFKTEGMSLGRGRGQRYERNPDDNRFYKMEG